MSRYLFCTAVLPSRMIAHAFVASNLFPLERAAAAACRDRAVLVTAPSECIQANQNCGYWAYPHLRSRNLPILSSSLACKLTDLGIKSFCPAQIPKCKFSYFFVFILSSQIEGDSGIGSCTHLPCPTLPLFLPLFFSISLAVHNFFSSRIFPAIHHSQPLHFPS